MSKGITAWMRLGAWWKRIFDEVREYGIRKRGNGAMRDISCQGWLLMI